MSGLSDALLILPNDADPSRPGMAELELVRAYALTQEVALKEVTFSQFCREPGAHLTDTRHVVSWAFDEQLPVLADLAQRENFSLGFLPAAGNTLVHHWFDIPRKLPDASILAFRSEPLALDLLRCNDEIALGMVSVGETPFIMRAKSHEGWLAAFAGWLFVFWHSLLRLFSIQPFPVTLRYGDDKTLKTALVGIIAPENEVKGVAAKLLGTRLSAQDGLISCILLAPKSVREYLHFLVAGWFSAHWSLNGLPKAVSFIRSTQVCFEANTPLSYVVDGKRREATSIQLTLVPASLRLNVPESYRLLLQGAQPARESLHLEHLPQKDQRIQLIAQRLPYFTRALEDEFRELFLQLRENARITGNFLMLMVLSSVIATLGLLQSSPAVIIGAMVLAPLMAPIISFAMGLLRAESGLVKRSLGTIAIGMLTAITTASVLVQWVPVVKVTAEIAARLQPNVLDLAIALASGVAGAFAYVRENIARSVSGVAIAVALVPPLCVVGIGVGWLDFAIVRGALLLFLTNLVGISLAAGLTFLLLGFAPLTKASRGLLVSLVMLVAVSVPLFHAFQTMVDLRRAEQLGRGEQFRVNGQEVTLDVMDVRLDSDDDIYLVIRAAIGSERSLTMNDLNLLQTTLEQRLNRRVSLELMPLTKVPHR